MSPISVGDHQFEVAVHVAKAVTGVRHMEFPVPTLYFVRNLVGCNTRKSGQAIFNTGGASALRSIGSKVVI